MNQLFNPICCVMLRPFPTRPWCCCKAAWDQHGHAINADHHSRQPLSKVISDIFAVIFDRIFDRAGLSGIGKEAARSIGGAGSFCGLGASFGSPHWALWADTLHLRQQHCLSQEGEEEAGGPEMGGLLHSARAVCGSAVPAGPHLRLS